MQKLATRSLQGLLLVTTLNLVVAACSDDKPAGGAGTNGVGGSGGAAGSSGAGGSGASSDGGAGTAGLGGEAGMAGAGGSGECASIPICTADNQCSGLRDQCISGRCCGVYWGCTACSCDAQCEKGSVCGVDQQCGECRDNSDCPPDRPTCNVGIDGGPWSCW